MPAPASPSHVAQIAERLRSALEGTKIAHVHLAALAGGFDPSAVGRLINEDEKGHRRLPDLTKLHRIAHVLGVTAGWLVFGEGPEPEFRPVDRQYWDKRFTESKAKPDGSQAA